MPTGTVATRTYTGAGAAVNLAIGFKPAFVRIINLTDSVAYEWSDTMAQGGGIQTTGTAATISNGVSHYGDNEGDTGHGITLGTTLAANASVYHVIAFRGDA